MIEVKNVVYQDEFKIWIEFNDGTKGIADLYNDLWGIIFEPLRDIDFFKKFRVSDVTNTIEWENEADFAPEFLYEKIKTISKQLAEQKF